MTATSGAALLKKINPQLKRVRVHICLRPDLITEFHRKESELQQSYQDDVAAAGSEGRARLASKGEMDPRIYSDTTKALAADVDKLEKRIAEADTVFVIEAMPKDEWATHVAGHAPRKDNHFDLLAGYNRDAALDAAVRPTLVDPEFEDCTETDCDHKKCGTWQALMRVMASSEWEELKNGVAQANTETSDLPKSTWAARVLASSADDSASPRRGASRSARSTGGRRARS